MGEEKIKKNCEDIATGTSDENDEETTKFRKTCRKYGINPDLIMLKVTLFVMYGATASLLPYLTIHMRSVGLTLKEISFVYLALPFTTFLSPPITGYLVDKFGQYKPVVVIALLLNAAFHHALYLLPSQEVKGVFPDAYVIRHPLEDKTEIWWSPCPSRECPPQEDIDLVLDRCIDHCLLRDAENFVTTTNKALIDPGDKDDLNLHISKTKNKQKKNYVAKSNRSTHTIDPLIRELEKNNSNYDDENLRNMVVVNITGNMEEPYSDAAYFLVDMHSDLEGAPESLGMELEPEINETAIDFKRNFGEPLFLKYGVNITELDQLDLRCGGIVTQSNKTDFAANVKLSEWAANCMVQKCRFIRGGPEQCPPDYNECDDMTFWIYFVLRFFGSIMLSAGVTIMDPIALQMIEQYGGDYGREKLFSSIGMAIFSPITGVLIDVSTRQMGYADYSAAFYTYDILLTVSTLTVLMMPLGAKLPSDNIFTDLMNLLQMPHVIMFIIFLFCLGNFWGFIESFLFLYLTELGAPNYLLGITVTVGTVSSMPFLYGAEAITAKVGHVYVIVIAFLSHAARLVGYSFIENAWWCFPFEALESLSVHLMWVAAATYCAMLAPKSLLATLIGVLGMSHFSLGRGSGSFGGGLMIEQVGIREAFRYMGLIALILGIIYFILHFFWLKHYEDVAVEGIEAEDVETGESAKLNREPLTKEVSTMVSVERLHMMIDYNPLGSLTSLPRGSRARLSQGDINELYRSRSNSTRRSSNVEISNKTTPRGSASKVDLLKSALEINHHNQNQQHQQNHARNNNSNPALSRNERISHHKLTNSAPKLSQKNVSQSLLPLIDHERILSRRDSIPEEIEEGRILQITAPAKVGHRAVQSAASTRGSNAAALKEQTNPQKDNEHRKSWNHDDNKPT